MSFFMSSENWVKVCMSFFMSSENWSKSHRFVCRFLCRPKTGQKVIGLYVVFVCRPKTVKKS